VITKPGIKPQVVFRQDLAGFSDLIDILNILDIIRGMFKT
jgi:hypothetical protein